MIPHRSPLLMLDQWYCMELLYKRAHIRLIMFCVPVLPLLPVLEYYHTDKVVCKYVLCFVITHNQVIQFKVDESEEL